MATRMAVRYVSRRFSSGGKILSEEEKAAENVYIKKTEQEKLQKLARKGPKPEETAAAGGSGGSVTDAKPSSSTSSAGASTEKVSTDSYKNYAVLAGVVTVAGAVGWYMFSKEKKQEVKE
ncbi:hypothetical protein CCACVL1_02795 [Corchorus capsularis]|uniref:Copper ion binding protein n=1 Tax=Corchorus capsularis TaxID=210143 RepID=A0A1R3K5V6_COCAP|nr:hypothetical protein CCACVL1_02795 [Corchorus capsularis]